MDHTGTFQTGHRTARRSRQLDPLVLAAPGCDSAVKAVAHQGDARSIALTSQQPQRLTVTFDGAAVRLRRGAIDLA